MGGGCGGGRWKDDDGGGDSGRRGGLSSYDAGREGGGGASNRFNEDAGDDEPGAGAGKALLSGGEGAASRLESELRDGGGGDGTGKALLSIFLASSEGESSLSLIPVKYAFLEFMGLSVIELLDVLLFPLSSVDFPTFVEG